MNFDALAYSPWERAKGEEHVDAMLISAAELAAGTDAVVVDCRFSLADTGAGRAAWEAGHVPGAHYAHLNDDLSGPVGRHGGRHPLPDPAVFAAWLASLGIGPDTPVVAYDDSRLAFAARLWWLMRSLGYRPPRLLDGGYAAFLAAGGQAGTRAPRAQPCPVPPVGAFTGRCDFEGLRGALAAGAVLVDAREAPRYAGLDEPIDPVAGHIPGALNRPWQGVTDTAGGVRDAAGQRDHWGDLLEAPRLIVYCGSGVTACANLFSLALLGRGGDTLYAGSWSDWCSHLGEAL